MSEAARTGVVKTWALEDTGKIRKGCPIREPRLVEQPAYTKPDEPLVVFLPRGEEPGRYGIFHTASGLSLTGGLWFRSFAKAKRAMKEIGQLADWTQGKEAFEGKKMLGQDIKAIAIEYSAK